MVAQTLQRSEYKFFQHPRSSNFYFLKRLDNKLECLIKMKIILINICCLITRN